MISQFIDFSVKTFKIKELSSIFQSWKSRILNSISKNYYNLKRFLSPLGSVLSRVYFVLVFVVSKICEALTFIIESTAESILFILCKISNFFKYINRKIYVWRILSARNQWYQGKKGNFYNPKLQASIYPSWECTWNMVRSNTHYKGFDSKDYAQEVAFKMWMKKRLLKKRLDSINNDILIPLNLKQKIVSHRVRTRSANFYDTQQILNLLGQLGYSKTDEDMRLRIQTYADHSFHQIIVAEKGKKVVGFIAFVMYDSFVSEGKRCHIEGLVIDSKYANLKTRQKLIEAAEVFARQNSSKVIDLTTSVLCSKNGVHDFYKFLGYQNEGTSARIYLRKVL